MALPKFPERGRFLVVSVILLFIPAIFLMVTLLILIIGRNILVNDLTFARTAELYLVKVALFTVFLFVLYKILENVSEQQIPEILDAADRRKREEESPENNRSEPISESNGRYKNKNR